MNVDKHANGNQPESPKSSHPDYLEMSLPDYLALLMTTYEKRAFGPKSIRYVVGNLCKVIKTGHSRSYIYRRLCEEIRFRNIK